MRRADSPRDDHDTISHDEDVVTPPEDESDFESVVLPSAVSDYPVKSEERQRDVSSFMVAQENNVTNNAPSSRIPKKGLLNTMPHNNALPSDSLSYKNEGFEAASSNNYKDRLLVNDNKEDFLSPSEQYHQHAGVPKEYMLCCGYFNSLSRVNLRNKVVYPSSSSKAFPEISKNAEVKSNSYEVIPPAKSLRMNGHHSRMLSSSQEAVFYTTHTENIYGPDHLEMTDSVLIVINYKQRLAGTSSGEVSIFEKDSGGNWGYLTKLKGISVGNYFDRRVGISSSGNTIAVAAYKIDSCGYSTPVQILIYEKTSSWTEVVTATLDLTETLTGCNGISDFAVSDDMVLIGVPNANSDIGLVYFVTRNGAGNWIVNTDNWIRIKA